MKRCAWIVGIDEAGRGPIAGPVAVGVVAMRRSVYVRLQKKFPDVRDSKKLTQKNREEWFAQIRQWQAEDNIRFSVALGSEKVIDKKGITHALRLCMTRGLGRVGANGTTHGVLLDGSLRAPAEFTTQQTIIKGDERELIIAFASIVAKVTRDQKMLRLAKKYPSYGFDRHKGYGTKAHYTALKKHGISPIHRVTYLKRFGM